MKYRIEELQKRIVALENRLEDVQKRLPAHSVKPTIMHEIFSLEDELEELNRELKSLQQTA